MRTYRHSIVISAALSITIQLILCLLPRITQAAQAKLFAGVAKADITSPAATKVHDPCFAKVLALKQGETSAVLITVDAVAIGGIGPIGDAFLGTVRAELAKDPGIAADNVLVVASHCHGVVRSDCESTVIDLVRQAFRNLEQVQVSRGSCSEKRISENRRVVLKDGSQVDMRRAYSFAWDNEIDSIGPIDPQVGLLKLDRLDGKTLALIYNFACHPIMNPPSKGSSADFPGVASKLIEHSLGPQSMAFFVQGCGGDINPVQYKEITQPANAETLGNLLGSTIIQALPTLSPQTESTLAIRSRNVPIPRADDIENRIQRLEQSRLRLVESLKSTNINFKAFVPLLIQQRLSPEFPSASAQAYRHQQQQGLEDLTIADADKREQVEAYLSNIQTMEQITRLNTNLSLLKMHLGKVKQSPLPTINCQMCAWRIGDFRLVTFPGELTVEIGIKLKKEMPKNSYVAGYANGYVHYLPTVEQRGNTGFAQEDCDCMVAPQWQRIFEEGVKEILSGL